MEFYQLIDCTTGEPFAINNQMVYFAFDGTYTGNANPDDFYGKVVNYFEDSIGTQYQGCWTFGEVDCDYDNDPLPYDTSFRNPTFVETCAECLPTPVPEYVPAIGRMIYPERIGTLVPPDAIEQISCTFAKAMYQKMIRERYGLNNCCDIDLVDAQIDFEILKLDMVNDKDACCPVN